METETVDSIVPPDDGVEVEVGEDDDAPARDELASDGPAEPEPEVEPEAEAKEDDRRSVTALVELLGRRFGVLLIREARLETQRNLPAARRVALELGLAVVAVIALSLAFVLANVAALDALAHELPLWAAALVLAGLWTAVGLVLLLGMWARLRRHWTPALARRPAVAIAELEQSRDAAIDDVRETLEQLGPALTIEIAAAVVPSAGEVAGGMLEAGDALLDASDEIVDAIADELPAGSVVNQIWAVALIPGRFGLRAATTVLRREPPRSGA
jgi:Putative Actinobacterial Holin-X, holin superfamily III